MCHCTSLEYLQKAQIISLGALNKGESLQEGCVQEFLIPLEHKKKLLYLSWNEDFHFSVEGVGVLH